MIYIQAHADFNISNIISNIDESNYNNFSIISTKLYDKLKNNYPISITYETNRNNPLFNKHDVYGDVTYKNYIYSNLDLFDDNIFGFVQYKRYFSSYALNNYKDILKEYDIIMPGKYHCLSLIYQWSRCQGSKILENMFDLICDHDDSYKKINIYNISFIWPHSMFIMKRNDFILYNQFVNWCLNAYNEKYGELANNRIYSYLTERLTSIFVYKHFYGKKIYEEWIDL